MATRDQALLQVWVPPSRGAGLDPFLDYGNTPKGLGDLRAPPFRRLRAGQSAVLKNLRTAPVPIVPASSPPLPTNPATV